MNSSRPSINYLYFGLFFLVLVLTSAGNIFERADLTGSRIYFFLYAFGQALFEVSLLVLIAALLKGVGKKSFYAFIGFTFLVFIFHGLDFMMSRILDLSVLDALKMFVFEETLENFLVLLEASGIPNWMWATFFLSLTALPLLGILFYKALEKITNRHPLVVRRMYLLQILLCTPVALAFWDFSAGRILHPDAYTAFIKAIPWKCTFSCPDKAVWITNGSLKAPKTQEEILASVALDATVLKKKPNIYLFVIESLREDSITSEVAPNLYQFKKTHTSFDLAVSNGNGTHISWFSIFHSQFPYLWSQMQKGWNIGSPALNLLKKWGYQVRLYSSAELNYYGMEKHIFGNNLQLLDHYETFQHAPPITAADTDTAAIARLNEDLAKYPELREGQICIVFLDGTHFDYSWPKNWTPKFPTFAACTSYFQLFQSGTSINLMKNRYYNAVNYLDHLFGKFMGALPNKEEAIVVVTGDHGEEFFEQGNLFHNSHLAKEQMHIPLYFKFGNQEKEIAPRKVVSQMDIFPSVIDYLGGSTALLEGESLFQKSKWPFALTARFNASSTPNEFALHNGENKLILQFTSGLASKQLRIVSLKTKNDKSLLKCDEIQPWVTREFGPALDRLFRNE